MKKIIYCLSAGMLLNSVLESSVEATGNKRSYFSEYSSDSDSEHDRRHSYHKHRNRSEGRYHKHRDYSEGHYHKHRDYSEGHYHKHRDYSEEHLHEYQSDYSYDKDGYHSYDTDSRSSRPIKNAVAQVLLKGTPEDNSDHFWSERDAAALKKGPLILGNTTFDGVKLTGEGGRSVEIEDDVSRKIIMSILQDFKNKTNRFKYMFCTEDREEFCRRFDKEYFRVLCKKVGFLQKMLHRIGSNILLKIVTNKNGLSEYGFKLGLWRIPNLVTKHVVGDVIVDALNQCLYREGRIVEFPSDNIALLDKLGGRGGFLKGEEKYLRSLFEVIGCDAESYLKTCVSCVGNDNVLWKEYTDSMLRSYKGDISVGDVSFIGDQLTIKEQTVKIADKVKQMSFKYLLCCANDGFKEFEPISKNALPALLNGVTVKVEELKQYYTELRKDLIHKGSVVQLMGIVNERATRAASIVSFWVHIRRGEERKYYDIFLNAEDNYLRRGDELIYSPKDVFGFLDGLRDSTISPAISPEKALLLNEGLKLLGSEIRVKQERGKWRVVVPEEMKRKLTSPSGSEVPQKRPRVGGGNNFSSMDDDVELQSEVGADGGNDAIQKVDISKLYADISPVVAVISLDSKDNVSTDLKDCLAVAGGMDSKQVIDAIVQFNQELRRKFSDKIHGDVIDIECTLSRRLDNKEKMRLRGANSVLYGYILTRGSGTTYNAVSAFMRGRGQVDEVVNIIQAINQALEGKIVNIVFKMSEENLKKFEAIEGSL